MVRPVQFFIFDWSFVWWWVNKSYRLCSISSCFLVISLYRTLPKQQIVYFIAVVSATASSTFHHLSKRRCSIRRLHRVTMTFGNGIWFFGISCSQNKHRLPEKRFVQLKRVEWLMQKDFDVEPSPVTFLADWIPGGVVSFGCVEGVLEQNMTGPWFEFSEICLLIQL